MARVGRILALCLVVAALGAAGCGDDGGSKGSATNGSSGGSGGGGSGGGGGKCLDADKALQTAVRSPVATFKVAQDGGEGTIDRVEVDVCRTTETDARATVIAYGLRDDSIQDVKHEVTAVRTGGQWTITNDLETRRCKKGRGHQEFSGDICQ